MGFSLTLRKGVQFGGDEVVKAKDGAGSATLSMAFAGFRCVLRRISNMEELNIRAQVCRKRHQGRPRNQRHC